MRSFFQALALTFFATPLWAEPAMFAHFLERKAPHVDTSFEIIRLQDGTRLAAVDQDRILAPASTVKLLTAGAALHYFSPAHSFHTRFFHSGHRKSGRIHGNLYVVGDGDPLLISEKLWQFAADIKNMGIKAIMGDIIIDGSLFDNESFDRSREHALSRSVNAYDAPVTALGVNFNTVTVAIYGGEQIGKPGLLSTDPVTLDSIALINQTKTARMRGRSQVFVERLGDVKSEKTKVAVKGKAAFGDRLLKIPRSIGNPTIFAGEYVKAFLAGEGITVSGGIREGELPPTGMGFLYDLESYPLMRIIEGLNKYSNNYIADVLTKRLGAAFPQSGPADARGSGSYANGLALMRKFMTEVVKSSGDFVIRNGSGLDIENRMSAGQLAKLLAYMEKRMDLFPEFLASLPAAGWDGTLKKRFNHQAALIGGVRAKTGTLSEPITVVSLAGYVRLEKHGLCAFALIQNGKLGKPQPGIESLRKIQDEFLQLLADKL